MDKKFYISISMIVLLCIGLIIAMSTVSAHPPSKVTLSYDEISGVLTIVVDHPSEDYTIHNIARVDITKNGVPVDENESSKFGWDQNEDGLVATYNFSAFDGDEITATAYCSIEGSQAGTLVIGQDANSDGESTPGFEMFGLLIAGLIYLSWCIVRKNR